MIRTIAYWTGTHKDTFRPGERATILGVEIITPDGKDPRPCIHVSYNGHYEDWIPLSQVIGSDAIGVIS